MNTIFAKLNFWNLFIGITLGVGVSVLLFSALVPSGADMITLYHLKDGAHMDGNGNIMTEATSSHGSMSMTTITSEKQFLQEMITHHEAAVTMSTQALTLRLHPEVATLAKNIISAQTTEIKMMKDWLIRFK